MAKITLENIKKIYQGNVTAVHDFNLEIKDKEFVVFVGPSGCGKSTTLRMIAGLEEISEGSLKIDDVLVNDLQPKDRGVSMVFQNYALYPHLSVFENLAFPLRLAKVPTEVEKTEKEIEEIEKQILLIQQDIDTLNTAMADASLVAKTEEEINRKCDPLLAKIEANKAKAVILQAKKECREFVQKKVEEAQVLDDEISELKAKAYAEDTPKEEAKKLVKEIKAKEKALAKVRNKAEHPVPAGKLERINDALNALSYKNVLLEEKVNNIKKTTSLSVRLDSFKEELERLEQE
ncbi:MAG: ATP-binding cassette domain-containing protein, partial [Bacilli bacterium]|nr:ATP-binding cassette domain-containing protein [Bacilli bacterium]